MRIIDGAGKFTRADGATHWVEQLRVPDLSVGTYSIPAGSVDDQAPHTEDEIYVVTTGRATFEAGGDRGAGGPGLVIYLPAREGHRFAGLGQDPATRLLFAPAAGFPALPAHRVSPIRRAGRPRISPSGRPRHQPGR